MTNALREAWSQHTLEVGIESEPVACERGRLKFLSSLLNHIPARVAAHFSSEGVAARVLRPLIEHGLQEGEVVAVVRSGAGRGIKLALDPRTEKYYWAGRHDIPVQEALMRTLRDGAVFWDVGAHIGFFTILGSQRVGPGGRVHAFEPMPSNRRRLERAIQMNVARNVDVHASAVGSLDGSATLHGHDASAMWTLVPERGGSDGIDVECRTFDALALELGDPSVIKVDVEGAELDAIRGGLEMIGRATPTMVVEFAEPENVVVARALLPTYRFDQISDLDWLLAPMITSGPRDE